jgi:hypothetical protein
MANNIKIVGSITNSDTVSRYSDNDARLINSFSLQEEFGSPSDYIEYFLYDTSGNLLYSNYDYKNFKLPTTSRLTPNASSSFNINNSIPSENIGIESIITSGSSLPIIEIDPVKDIQNLGYNSGEFKTQYNFFKNKISDYNSELFIKEISSDRTELRVCSTTFTNIELETKVTELINQATNSRYYTDFILNFGNNIQVLATNIALNQVDTGYEILFKLYQPLSLDITEKFSLWVVEEIISPYVFDISIDTEIPSPEVKNLRGPNFSVKINEHNNVATSYLNYTSLINNTIPSSSYRQLLNLVNSQSIDINVDYSNFSNFSFFGSATQRVNNFYTKVKQIEDYQNLISYYTSSVSTTSSLQTSINSWTSSINNTITNFDGFESYLYFESGSTLTSSAEFGITPYPKSGSFKPYSVYSTGSSLVTTWYNATTASAEVYDIYNNNKFLDSVPSFVSEDDDNASYFTFLNMVGHYFDNIWVFLQTVTDINLANNNLDKGISKDLVYLSLQSLGVNLYNKYGNSDNISFLLGANSGSNAVSFDATGSLTSFTTSSFYLNNIPRRDLLAETYKRIYHNLPLLTKNKGTVKGLQSFISTFGITGSVLNIKEYGGDLKSGLLNEYNTDKVRIVSSSIVTGSVLSPFISVLNYPSESTSFRTNDLHYVDISFSPQDKINIFASQSISSSAHPTWSLDDFIGDPAYQYSSSYTTLESERKTYYSPLSFHVIPFYNTVGTGSIAATDYNNFIRLIQYFDNSLFKMLKEYIPARANLSTGVTISSPVLERNKWSYSNPSSTSQIQENDGVVSGPTIKTEYNNLYSNLTGSKAAYYTGEITGSILNVYNYFVSGNINPYLVLTSSLTSANLNEFNHSKFNVTLNNVSSSRTSLTRQKLEISGSSGMLGKGSHALLTTASLQDSYEFLKTHQLSRYDGVKLFSAKYNDYTDGDTSFGKAAVIDRNSIKLGLFSEIVANKFLPKRNNAVLKYLVDIDGNFTELNQRNTHWQEVQNIFKINNTGSVSLFNDQLYSNQKITNGEKLIFDSGYTYSPLLYFGTGSIDTKVYFENIEDPSSYLITAQNSGSSYYITGSSSNLFPIQSSTGKMFNLFNKEILDSDNVFTPGNSTATSASYTALDSGDYKLIASFDLSLTIPSGGSGSYTLKLLKNGAAFSPAIQDTQTITILNETTASNSQTTLYTYQTVLYPTTVTSNKAIYLSGLSRPAGTTFIKWNAYFLTSSAYPPYPTCTFGGGSGEWYSLNNNGYIVTPIDCSIASVTSMFSFEDTVYQIEDFDTPTGTVTKTVSINKPQSNPITLTKNDILTLEFSQSYVSVIGGGSVYTASITQGSLEISSLATTTGYSFTSYPYFNSSSLSASIAVGSGSNTITFTSALSNFNNAGYQFVPNPLSGSISSLYSISASYGDVDYQFNINPYDMVVAQLSDNSYVESRILSSSISSSFLQIHLDSDMPSLFKTNIMSGSYQRFLLLKKIEDETNVHLSFIKRAGKTSYGFLIPEDINQSILDNIDTITKEAKQKLLNDQSVISGSL